MKIQETDRMIDLKKLKEILDNQFTTSEQKEWAIVRTLAQEPRVIDIILMILREERSRNEEFAMDAGFALATAHSYIHDIKIRKRKKPMISLPIVIGRIKGFYKKYEGKICHSIPGLLKDE